MAREVTYHCFGCWERLIYCDTCRRWLHASRFNTHECDIDEVNPCAEVDPRAAEDAPAVVEA